MDSAELQFGGGGLAVEKSVAVHDALSQLRQGVAIRSSAS